MSRLFSFRALSAYTFFIFFLSVIPIKIQQPAFAYSDKIIHFLMYALLSFLAINTFAKRNKENYRLQAFFYSFFVGLLIEFIQFFLPYRSFEMYDILSNFIGCLTGIIKVI